MNVNKLDRIELQVKYHDSVTPEDWRSFAIITDEFGDKWELRGYGDTPEKALADIKERIEDVEGWDIYGYIIETREEIEKWMKDNEII